MIDASFEKITDIQHHPNADKLDVGKIGGWTVVVGRDQFKDGDMVFYIREDAQLMKNPEKWPWQANAMKMASTSGRIKVVKLRDIMSAGLCVPIDEVYAHINDPAARNWEEDNKILKSEFPAGFLLGKFGIKHYELPCPRDGESVGGLVFGMPKSDEENWQNLTDEGQIPWGEKCLVTKKLDGSSMAVCCDVDGTYHICSRSLEKMKGVDNNFNRAAEGVWQLGCQWAKEHGKRICLRGELTAHNVQQFNHNKDRDINGGKPTFNLYGIFMPDELDFHDRQGRYGSKYHFLKIVDEIEKMSGIRLQHVPILETDVPLTKELLEKYMNMPKDFGEGVVVGFWNGVGSCKSKSLDYLGKLSKIL